jgi:hypothetical protein
MTNEFSQRISIYVVKSGSCIFHLKSEAILQINNKFSKKESNDNS